MLQSGEHESVWDVSLQSKHCNEYFIKPQFHSMFSAFLLGLHGYFLIYLSLISSETLINESYVPKFACTLLLLHFSSWSQYQSQESLQVLCIMAM